MVHIRSIAGQYLADCPFSPKPHDIVPAIYHTTIYGVKMAHPEPLEIIIGDTLSWKRLYTDVTYIDSDGDTQECKASDGYTLKYSFAAPVASAAFTITASADDDDYLVSVTAAVTALYVASDDYSWVAYAEYGSGVTLKRYTIDRGTCKVKAGYSSYSAEFDNRTHAKIVLDAIEAVLQSRATMDQMSYTIGGRRLDRTPIADLLKLRNLYKFEYEAEQAAENIGSGLASGRKILTRFPEY